MLSEKSALRKFNLSVFIHFIGRFMYAIFVPIILLKNGYSLNLVLAYLLLSSLVTTISSYISQKTFQHHRVIFFNYLAIIAEIFLLLMFSFSHYTALIFTGILVFEGLYYGFYYISYLSIINHYSKHNHTGINIGNVTSALTLAGMIAPLIGALLLGYGTIYLIITSAFFLFISILPLFKINKDDINGFDRPKIKIKEIKKELFAYIIMSSVELVIFTMWSIYAYIDGLSLLQISSIAIAASFANLVVTQKVKTRLMQKGVRHKIKYLSIILIIILSLYRFYLPEHILITNFLFGIVFLLFYMNTETELFTKLQKTQTYHSSAIANMTCFMSRAVVALITLIIGIKYIILLPIPLVIIYFFSVYGENKKIST
ncbi:MAG: MFS transporter [bacterium]|nr:MFS transporter [bacterium]